MKNIARGGYILKDSGGKPDVILIATGSEVEITVKAAEKLTAEVTRCAWFPAFNGYL